MNATDLINAVIDGQDTQDVLDEALQVELLEQSTKVHTAWKWIPKNWQSQFEKKKVKRKAGEDETVTLYPEYGEASVGKGMFKMKTIEPGKPEVQKVINRLKSSQKW